MASWLVYTFAGGTFTPGTDWSLQALGGTASDSGQPISHLVLPDPGLGQCAVYWAFFNNAGTLTIKVNQAGAGAAACQISMGGDFQEITATGDVVLGYPAGPVPIIVTRNGAIDLRGLITDNPLTGAIGKPPSSGGLESAIVVNPS